LRILVRNDAWLSAASFVVIVAGVDVVGAADVAVVSAPGVDVDVIGADRLAESEEHPAARSVTAKTPAVREDRIRARTMNSSAWLKSVI
jgi:hypothetical protein